MAAVLETLLEQGSYPSNQQTLNRMRPYRLLTRLDKKHFSTHLEYVYEDRNEVVRLVNKPENQTYAMQIADARFWAKYFEDDKQRIRDDKSLNEPMRQEKLQKHDLKVARYLQKAQTIESLQRATGRQ